MLDRTKHIWRTYVLAPIRAKRNRKYIIEEERKSYGRENPDKTFFVIRRNAPEVGLFSFVCTGMGWMKYAIDNGYIPVMDMQSFPNGYLAKNEVGKKNAWELFYEQPCGYTLDDIKRSKNVILSKNGAPEEYPSLDMYDDNDKLNMWCEFAKKYLRIVPSIAEDIEKGAEELKSKYGKVIGVNIRGTDYTESKPKGHPVQPTMEEAIRDTEEKIKEWGCEAIYLATEDESIVDAFKEKFGDMVILPEGRRYDYRKPHKTYTNENGFDRENDPFLKGREYLVKIGILSKLDYIATSFMGSAYGMTLMNKDYKGVLYWNKGVY